MKTLKEIRKILNEHRSVLEEKYKVREIALFGSFARGDQDETSDIDILVGLREPVGFLFIHRMSDWHPGLFRLGGSASFQPCLKVK